MPPEHVLRTPNYRKDCNLHGLTRDDVGPIWTHSRRGGVIVSGELVWERLKPETTDKLIETSDETRTHLINVCRGRRTERKVRRHRPVLNRVLYRAELSQTVSIP